MTYPLSSDVSAGQPTAAAHYNNLRADALRFGQTEADAVYLAALLSKFQNGLKITRLDTDRVRVAATTSNPVSIVIDGIPLQATSNVDLATTAKPSGAGATYYVFAVRSAASTTFTLSVNTSPTAATGQRRIGSFYFNGSAIEPNTIKTVEADFYADLLGLIAAKTCNGRLTLTSGVPVTVEDVTSAGTVYFTPYKGNLVGLRQPDGTWKLHTFTQLSASLAGIASGKNVDLFIYDNAGTLTLETVQWASDTARATDLASLDGVLVKNGDSSAASWVQSAPTPPPPPATQPLRGWSPTTTTASPAKFYSILQPPHGPPPTSKAPGARPTTTQPTTSKPFPVTPRSSWISPCAPWAAAFHSKALPELA